MSEQQRLINHDGRPFCVLAAPGSGKTTTIGDYVSRRVKHGVDRLALLTYTNVGVGELEAALARAGCRLAPPRHFVGTIDSFIQRFLFYPWITTIVKNPKPVMIVDAPFPAAAVAVTVKVRMRNRDVPVPAIELIASRIGPDIVYHSKANFAKILVDGGSASSAQRDLLARGFVTMNGINAFAFNFTANATIIDLVRRRFPEIIVDEAQDTSELQQGCFDRLASAGVRFGFVGDPNQSIYKFQGANPQYLAHKGADSAYVQYRLTNNHRSTREIINVYSALIPAVVEAKAPHAELSPSVFTAVSTADSACEQFQKLLTASELHEGSAAILSYTNETVSLLSNRDVVAVSGKGSIKHFIAAAAGYHGGQSSIDTLRHAFEALRTVVKAPREHLTTFRPRDESWREQRRFLWNFVCNVLPDPRRDALEWHRELLGNLRVWAKNNELTLVSNLTTILAKRGLVGGQNIIGPEKPRTTLRVDTIHGAKGQSIDSVCVFITEGDQRAIEKAEAIEDSAQLPEHIRLIYVALSRAKRLLFIALPSTEAQLYWEKRFGICK